MAEDQTKIITLRMPDSLHRKLKMLSGLTGKSMTAILFECIEDRFKGSGLPEPVADKDNNP